MEQEQLDQTIKMAIAAKDDELLNSLTGFIYKDEVEKLLITGSENLGKSILGVCFFSCFSSLSFLYRSLL